jgi:hypothetical protein
MVNPRSLESILNRLAQYADKSKNMHRHSAAIVKGDRPFIWGFNSGYDNWHNRHAEQSVIESYLRSKGLRGFNVESWREAKRRPKGPKQN